jgi:hypothetical protein
MAGSTAAGAPTASRVRSETSRARSSTRAGWSSHWSSPRYGSFTRSSSGSSTARTSGRSSETSTNARSRARAADSGTRPLPLHPWPARLGGSGRLRPQMGHRARGDRRPRPEHRSHRQQPLTHSPASSARPPPTPPPHARLAQPPQKGGQADHRAGPRRLGPQRQLGRRGGAPASRRLHRHRAGLRRRAIPAQGETLLQLVGAQPGSCVGGDPVQTFNLVPYPGAPPGAVDASLKPSLFPSCFANDLPASTAARSSS